VLTALRRIGLVLFTCCLAQSQTVDKSLTFEVASVKPAAPPSANGRGMIMFRPPSGGPGTKDPGRISYPFISLKNLLMNAYDVKNYQIAGPGWLDTERFDINATMPLDTTKEQFRMMLQNLLAERFKLSIHRESKELPAYVLSVGKGGPKMKESDPVAAGADPETAALPPPPPPGQPKMGPDGFPVIPMGSRGGLFMIMMPGRARMIGQQQTMLELANRLTGQLNRPVTDATGLTAKYDFVLTFAPDGMGGPMGGPIGPMGPPIGAVPVAPPAPGGRGVESPDGENLPTIFGALPQLGLKLEAKKDNVEMIVVDHVEKTPTEN
jgi:uncharacterized protein (TIGR03435 family)